MITTIIIDDEPSGIFTLKTLLGRANNKIKILGETTSASEGILLIEKNRPDIVFLDISMPEMSGFELLERLTFRDFKLVFTTAHRDYAIMAIKNKAFDYLLKPIELEDLLNCINNLLIELQPNKKVRTTELVEIPVKNGILFLKQSEIMRLQAAGSYTNLYLVDGNKHMVSKNLKECCSLLTPDLFFRCHHSNVVNLRLVTRLVQKDGLFIQMSDGNLVELSRRNKDEFLEKLKSL